MTPEQALALYLAGPDAVVAELCAVHNQVVALQQQVTAQEKEIARLSKDSSNSSKPPSSDITKAAKKPQGKKKKKNPRGGQPGHPKHERNPYRAEEIDQFWEYHCPSCPTCDHADLTLLSDLAPRCIQQVEVKEVVVHKEEHLAYAYYCAQCDKTHYAPFPDEVVRAGLFKARLTALVAYMKNGCHASFSTIRKFLRDVIGVSVCRGYLAKLIQKVSHALAPSYEQLLERLPLETRLNVDETGHKENGALFWTWVFKADLYVLFRIDKSRGSQVLIDTLGREFEGTIGCDYFSAYRKYMKDFNVAVQFCIAHLIRDVKFLIKLPDEQTRSYGRKLLAAIKRMFKVIHQQEQVSPSQPSCGTGKGQKAYLTHRSSTMPQAASARTERNRKMKRKTWPTAFVSMAKPTSVSLPRRGWTPPITWPNRPFVSSSSTVTSPKAREATQGREANERLWTIIGTCALQGRSAYHFILHAVHAYFYDKPAPSLLPGFT